MSLSYLIIGAGGTGGCIGAYLQNANKEVTFIARGQHLEDIRKNGLLIKTDLEKDIFLKDVKAYTQEEYNGKADVIFVCTKGYSLDGVIELIKRAAHAATVVIPILNIYGTGEKLQEKLPALKVLDGCIYIVAEILKPGVIIQKGKIFTLVFGRRDGAINDSILKQIDEDLIKSNIKSVLSSNIKRDTYKKFSYVSPQGAVGAFYNVTAGEIQKNQLIKKDYISCIEEVKAVGIKMGITLEEDIVEKNLKILYSLREDMTTSMQRDLINGHESEMDGLVFEVVRLAKKYKVEVPTYKKIAEKFGYRC